MTTRNKADYVSAGGAPVRWNARGGEAIAGNLGRDSSGKFTNVGGEGKLSAATQRMIDKKRRREEAKKKPAKSGSGSRARERAPEKTRAEIDAAGAESFEKIGYSKDEYQNLLEVSENVPTNSEKFSKLVADGIAEVVNGKVVLTGAGKSVLAAARAGKVGDAKEILARDAQRRSDMQKRDADIAKRNADAQAKRDEQQKPKGGGGGGGKKPAPKKPVVDPKKAEADAKQQAGDKLVRAIQQIDDFIAKNEKLTEDDPEKLSKDDIKQLREQRTEYEAGVKDVTGQSYAKFARGTDERTLKLLTPEIVKMRKKLADKSLSKAVKAKYKKQLKLLSDEYARVKKRQSGSTNKEKKPWPQNKPRWQKMYNDVAKRNPNMKPSQVHAIANRRYSDAGGQWMTIDTAERYKRTIKAFPFTARQRRRFMVALKHASHDQSSHGQRGSGGGSGAGMLVGMRAGAGTSDMFGDTVPRVPKKGKFVPLKGDQIDMFGETVPTTADLIPKGDAPKKPTFADSRIPTDGKAKQILGDSVDRDGNADPNGHIPIARHPKTPAFPDRYDLMDEKTRGIVDHVVKEGIDGVSYTREQAAQRVAQLQTEHRDYWHTGNDIQGENYRRAQQGAETRENFVWNSREVSKWRGISHHDEKFGNKDGIGATDRHTGRVRLVDVRRVDLSPANRKFLNEQFGAQADNMENASVIQATAAMQAWHQKKYDRKYKKMDMELARSRQAEDVFGGTGATPGARDYNLLMASWHMGRSEYLDAKAESVRQDTVEALSPIKTRTVQKHASHDQSSHGRRGSRGASYAGAYRFARRGGASVADARQFAKESAQLEGDRLRAERDAKRRPKQPTIAEAQRAVRDADANVVRARAELNKTESMLAKVEASNQSPIIKEQWRQRAIRQQRDLDNAEQQRTDAQALVQQRRDARNAPQQPTAPATAPTADIAVPTSGKPARVAPDGKIGLAGTETDAFGVNPADRYKLQHRIVDLADLKASNTLSGQINPDYDPALQPRDRSRASSQVQIEKLAKRMIPEYMTEDMRRIDTGSPIIDADGNILSGNGRVIAMQRQVDTPGVFEGKADAMRAEAIRAAERLGIDPAEVAKMKNPVVVRLLQDETIDKTAFAKEANSSGTLRMSPMEQARVDAMDLAPNFGTRMDIGDGSSIDMALRSKTNKGLIREFIDTVPENERGSILTAEGDLNPMGMYRLKAAIFTQTFPSEQGQRMARSLLDSVEPDLVSVQTGIAGSLPSISRAASLTRTGERAADLDPSTDIAVAVDTLARVRAAPQFEAAKPANRVDVFLDQDNMFTGNRDLVIDLTPAQKQLLRHVNSIASKPRVVRSFFNEIARMIEDTPLPGQTDIFAGGPAITLESIYNRAYTNATTRGEQ
jgi:hypothetical protein